MSQKRQVPRIRPIPDTEASADSWDGPHFQLSRCGINDFHSTPPTHAMFMDAMEPSGCWEYVLRGRVYYRLGDALHCVQTGEALVTRRPDPGWMIRPVEDEPVQTLWLGFKGEPALRLFDYLHVRFGQIQPLPPDCPAVDLAKRLVRLVAARPHRPAAFWSEKTFEWMNAWWQCMEQHRQAKQAPSLKAIRPSRLISYAPQTVKNFAAEVGYSRAYLTRKLTQQWKRSPGVVLREVRLQDAARLLRTTRLSIAEVARQVGYLSAPGFCRAFLHQYQTSPRRYRMANR